MAESAQKVLHELTAAGLLSSDHATQYGEELDTGADALLNKLVTDGHITPYQAEKFKDGKASDIYFGDYVVIDKLGQGGMGTVLLAKHRRMDRQVAIKVLPVTILESKDAVARFYQEVKVAAQLTHPGIVHAYDAGEHHGFHFLVMEYVPGHDLAQVLVQLGPIPAPMAIDYIMQVAAGLEYAHHKGIVHRDIKPSNLLLNDEGRIKILDMGLARLGNSLDQESSLHLTTTGQVMGTVEYMSPEQAEDARQADARSDIYSLGCTFYRLVTGNGPFSRDTIVKTILAHRDAPIPVIDTGSPDDESTNCLFQKMVAKDPANRFQTTTQLVEAIRQIEDGQPLSFSTLPPLVQPDSNTAVAIRFDDAVGDRGSIPEAIIPGPSGVDEVVAAYPIEPVPNSMDRQSDVMYIQDQEHSTRSIRGLLAWIKADRSRGIFLWGFISVAFLWFPPLGVIFGIATWRAANQDLEDILNGKRTSQNRWMTKAGQVLSIFAVFVGVLVFFGYFSFLG